MTRFFSVAFCLATATVVSAGMLAGCEKVEERDPCLQPRTVNLRVGAYRRAADTGTTVKDTALPLAILLPIGGQTAFSFAARSKLSLFLSPQADSCRYILSLDSGLTTALLDTLTFRYARRTQFLSNACGYTYFFTLDTVLATANRLDSVRITNREVTNDASVVEHLRLFYAR